MNSQYSKALNKTSIFKLVCIHGAVSRLELHRYTGLSKMTVTNLVGEFIQAGLMRQCGTEGSGVGRRTELIEVVPEAAMTIGVLITHHGLYITAVSLAGSYSHPVELELSPEETVDSLYDKIFAGVDRVMAAGGCFAGVVVSSIGCVNPHTNTLELETFFPRVGRVSDLSERITGRYGLPVFAENDANISALAQLYYGDGTDRNFIYVQVDEGIGAGLVMDGALFSTGNGFAGEIGHMTIVNDGVPCKCGNRGCLERYASTTATCQWYAAHRGRGTMDWPGLIAAAENEDRLAREAIGRMGSYLSSGLVNLINIVDADCIYIGDKGAEVLGQLNGEIEAEVNRRRFLQKHIRVRQASFPDDARIRGVAPLLIERGDLTALHHCAV